MNLIILYVPKSGSSALVEMLSRQPHIQVPLFEEVDGDHHRWCRSRVLEIIEDLFHGGGNGAVASVIPHDIQRLLPTIGFKPRALHTCFKWRPFCVDGWWVTREKKTWEVRLQEVLKENEVRPVLLVRKGLLGHALRIHFNNNYLEHMQPQFWTMSNLMSDEDYRALRCEVGQIRFEVNQDQQETVIKSMRNILEYAYCLKLYAQDFFALPNRWVYTEDLFSGKQPESSVYGLFEELSVAPDALEFSNGLFRPSGLRSISQCTNLRELRENESIVRLEHAYQVLTEQC